MKLKIWKFASTVKAIYNRRDTVVVILDKKGDGAGDEDKREAAEGCRWSSVAQISIATVNVFPIRLLAFIDAATIDLIVILLVVQIRKHFFLLQYTNKSPCQPTRIATFHQLFSLFYILFPMNGYWKSQKLTQLRCTNSFIIDITFMYTVLKTLSFWL